MLVIVNINFSSEGNEDHNLKGIEELKRRVSGKKRKTSGRLLRESGRGRPGN